jgi:hypothetical protein
MRLASCALRSWMTLASLLSGAVAGDRTGLLCGRDLDAGAQLPSLVDGDLHADRAVQQRRIETEERQQIVAETPPVQRERDRGQSGLYTGGGIGTKSPRASVE